MYRQSHNLRISGGLNTPFKNESVSPIDTPQLDLINKSQSFKDESSMAT